MAMDIKNALTSILSRKTMNRKTFLFSILGILAIPQPEIKKSLDMKDKHNFIIYLHEYTHKVDQVVTKCFSQTYMKNLYSTMQ